MTAPTPNLSSLPTTTPVATDNAGLGYANIIAISAALVNTFGYEHFLTGEHGIQRGAILPANVGSATKAALFIKTTAGVDDLYMDVGTGWINLTNNATYGLNAAALTTHKTAATIDHPDGSITSGKYAAASILSAVIANGQITAAHLATAIQALVNGGNADTLHTHATTSGKQEFTISGNFTVPAGITKILVTAVAAGGGGGGTFGITSGGGGGGGGEIYTDVPFDVTPGTVYVITIGAAGAGGNAGFAGTAGGNTIFPHALWTLTAVGGRGGNPGAPSAGGAGGAAGGVGSTAGDTGSYPSGIGGNGGDSLMGKGGTGGIYGGAVPTTGFGYGAGGGGGGGTAGAAGKGGFMVIRW